MEYTIVFLALATGAMLGLFAGWFWFSQGKKISTSLQTEINQKERDLRQIEKNILEAQNKLKTAEAEARATAREIVAEAKLHANESEAKIEKEQGRLEEKEKTLDQKAKELEHQRSAVETQLANVKALREELTDASAKHRAALENIAKLTESEAKEQLKGELEREFAPYYAAHLKQVKKNIEEELDEEVRNKLAEAMQRLASEVATESTSTIVQLPSDDVKGKIIGKEGRNIIAFEQMTGVDIIIDDTPGAIVISGYDLARRYVAKLAMEKLIKDGRIQPARIEEVVAKMKEEVGKMMLEFGKRAVEDLGITGYPSDLLKIIGRLRFRTSYGQNILKHSVEMAHLGRMLAEEIGADTQVVVEGCLLHDIGKALDHEVTGTHVEIGTEIARRYKVRDAVLHCIAAHHEDIPIASTEAFIVAAVDAISGARPGARRESIEAYIKRLKELEETAKGFPGVERAFAISAGREVRVFVDSKAVDDLAQEKLAKDISKKIESELTYPGVIKVNVIRDRRIEEVAK